MRFIGQFAFLEAFVKTQLTFEMPLRMLGYNRDDNMWRNVSNQAITGHVSCIINRRNWNSRLYRPDWSN
jgi:hypothetical protein